MIRTSRGLVRGGNYSFLFVYLPHPVCRRGFPKLKLGFSLFLLVCGLVGTVCVTLESKGFARAVVTHVHQEFEALTAQSLSELLGISIVFNEWYEYRASQGF